MSERDERTSLYAARVNAVARRFATMHRHLTAALLAERGLAIGQELLLLELGANGPCSQRHLADVARCEPSTITMAVRKLEAQGLVTRTRSRADARAQEVLLTESGRELLGQVHRVQQMVAERVVAGCAGDEGREQFLRQLEAATAAMTGED